MKTAEKILVRLGFLILLVFFLSCADKGISEEDKDKNEFVDDENKEDDDEDDDDNDDECTPSVVSNYLNLIDSPKDEGQYWLPEFKVIPKGYYVCTGKDFNNDNRYKIDIKNELEGLQYANMCMSLAGLVNRAVAEGKIKYAVWMDGGNSNSYKLCENDLINAGLYKVGTTDGITLLKSGLFSEIIKGYVLTDIVNNPESAVVATVASHVYSAVIVDVRDEKIYKNIGLKMLYDARNKKTPDAWNEFKNNCSNNALVVMSALTNDLKDFAISNNLFYMNTAGKEHYDDGLLNTVLDWLKPASPVYGCWDNTDEKSLVLEVSKRGHPMVVLNFFMNMSLTSFNYTERQSDLLVNVVDPTTLDYPENDNTKYVTYFMSDGDNVQWVFHDIWYNTSFKHRMTEQMKVSFGIPSTNLDMVSPSVYRNIVNNQNSENTLVEFCGGGYNYIDVYKTDNVLDLAKKVGANMRQHRIKVLGLFNSADNIDSPAAQAAYKAFIEANDWLEGIIVCAYAPYNAGRGKVLWYKNSKGIDIPVISVGYTIWNFGANGNNGGQGLPSYVASEVVKDKLDFSLIEIHVWSSFTDTGTPNNWAQEAVSGPVSNAGIAELCQRSIKSLNTDSDISFKNVSLQEFIWRLRMKHNRQQTMEVLGSYKIHK